MKDNLKFSIVIPSYNQGHLIEHTLLSIIEQDYKDFEIIVIDGGSVDETINVLNKYSPYIKYWVSEPDGGQSHAITKGFAVASGDILCWLNSDDIYLVNTLKQVNDAFIAEKADIVYGNKLIINESGQCVSYRLVTPFLPIILNDAYLCGGFGIYQPASFWTRNIYDQSGGIDQALRFCMDNDLFNKFVLLSAKFKFIDVYLAGFRVHSASKTSTLSSIAKEEQGILYKKYVIDTKIKHPNIKKFFARLYRLTWFFLNGKLPKMIYIRFFDQLKWVP